MERGSDKVSPREDDALKHDTEGLVRGGHATHAEEWKGSEPSGEDQPDVDLDPEGALVGGAPDGMTAEDAERRSELAAHLGRAAFPAVREQLLEHVIDDHAPDSIIEQVRRLPAGREFANVGEVWTALGGHSEEHRN